MQGMFRANGGCGYVKKPDMLLKNDDPNNVFDPRAALVVKKILKVKCNTSISIILQSFRFIICI